MKRKNCLYLAALAGLAASATAHAQFAFSNTIAGSFVDISGTGSLVTTGDDSSGPVTVSAAAANAAFPAGTLGACTNGHVGYGTDTQYFNIAIPSAAFYGGSTAAALYFDDLITHAAGAGVYSQEVSIGGVTVLVIQWNNMDHYFTSPSTGTFQLKIYGGGNSSTGTGPNGCFAQFIYQDVDFGDPVNDDNGISATIGFQINGTDGMQYSFNTASVSNGVTLSLVADVTGACCLQNGTCSNLFVSQCTSQGGVFSGAGSACSGTTCPQPGACCLPNLTCSDLISPTCTAQGGTFRGVGTACATATCPFGACCATDGTCGITIPATCTGGGGIYRGDGTTCATANCPMPPGMWVEQGDAGDFMETANITTGDGSLNSIRGVLGTDDADMYGIRICDPGNFSATTVGGATFDTQLFLFDASGLGIAADDDDPYGSATLQSHLSNLYTSSLPAGVFFLAVSSYNKDPMDGSAQYLWQNTPFNVERAPDGPGGANPMASFDNGSGYSNVPYVISLTGTCYAQAAPASCYANCDHSTQQPCLNVLDFGCFLNKFAAGDTYANCDQSTQPPVLNVLDFGCFLNRFAAGCSNC